MRKSIALILFLTIMTILAPQHINSAEELQRYNIMFHDEPDVLLIEKYDGVIHHQFDTIPVITATLTETAVKKLVNYKDIKLIEEDPQVELYSQQIDWGITKVRAPQAWTNQVTGKGIKVAVIDSGIDRSHPDLNVKEGISVVNYTQSFADDHGHGTHVAGTIAALNNSIGVVGVAPEVELYVVKALDKEGNGHHSDVVAGLEWVMEKGIDIVNLSFGSKDGSLILKAAVDKAYNKGILLVAAAGNRGTTNGTGNTVDFPAAYPNVIAVSAINDQNNRADFSATGNAVEVAAPGENILSTMRFRQYAYSSGTSMAAPHVAGVLALFKQANPRASHEELREMLKQHTIDLGVAGKDPWYGYGLVQVPEGVKITSYQPPSKPINVAATIKEESGQTIVNLTWNSSASDAQIVNYQIYRNQQLLKIIPNQTNFQDIIKKSDRYVYEIKAVDQYGLLSDFSEPITLDIQIKQGSPFTDVSIAAWYFPHLQFLYNEGYVYGYNDGTYLPQANVTRAEVAAMIGRVRNHSGVKQETIFSDVKKEHFASGFIQWGYENNIIKGYGDKTFRPNEPVTRGEVATFLSRAFVMPYYRTPADFPDVTKDYFAYYDIRSLSSARVAAGYNDGTFQPNAPITRAEFAVFLTRTINDLYKLQ